MSDSSLKLLRLSIAVAFTCGVRKVYCQGVESFECGACGCAGHTESTVNHAINCPVPLAMQVCGDDAIWRDATS